MSQKFRQREDANYSETFASVFMLGSLRVLLFMAAHVDLGLHYMDIVAAFLNGLFDENIFVD